MEVIVQDEDFNHFMQCMEAYRDRFNINDQTIEGCNHLLGAMATYTQFYHLQAHQQSEFQHLNAVQEFMSKTAEAISEAHEKEHEDV